ncbi:MAG: cytochrome c family protein [Sphingomonas bacterium]|uniref:c-type cytochrome n=1 Tax=Sphingomonas bacterium TaxID=1895847 RepID=UPI0026219628|nr:cytochrome c family protein [Sphingomonas bacterium]MDB5694466.1 cytochrome c family protein [Sphingomonas bacterium]
MDNRTNTIAGWTLAAFGAALAASIVGGMVFHGGEPAKEGYVIEGAAETGGEAAEVPIATLLASADAGKGADVFKKCSACHTIVPGGATGIGPNLHGIMGQPIAKKPGFAYSSALTGVGGNWDWDKMNAWLKSPRKFADGTKMTFAGLSKGEDRANVLAYLNAQGSNLPLPAAPPPGAAAAGASPVTGGNAPGTEGGQNQDAAPGAKSAIDAVATDRRAETGDIANTGTPASGAPSVDPGAQRQGAKVGR